MLNKILLVLNVFLLRRNISATFEIMHVECSPPYRMNMDLG